MRKGILFDLDGTLWDATNQITYVWNTELKRQGIDREITVEEFKGCMGLNIDEIARRVLPGVSTSAVESVVNECERLECEHLSTHGAILFPNVVKVLDILQKEYDLFIVSNCQVGYVEAFLNYYQLGHLFKDHECSGKTKMSKDKNIELVIERNKLDECIYVGDTIGDYNASLKAQIPFVYAAYGFGEVPEAKHKINSVDELLEQVKIAF